MSQIKWKDLSGEERFRVVELARRGEASIKELCETFGVSRQTLSKAIEKADQAAVVALEPKAPGRKPKTEDQVRAEKLESKTEQLEKELEHWQKKYEVAKTLIDLQRKLERGEPLPGEEDETPEKKRNRRKKRRQQRLKAKKR